MESQSSSEQPRGIVGAKGIKGKIVLGRYSKNPHWTKYIISIRYKPKKKKIKLDI